MANLKIYSFVIFKTDIIKHLYLPQYFYRTIYPANRFVGPKHFANIGNPWPFRLAYQA